MIFYHDTSCPAFQSDNRPCECGYRHPKDACENLQQSINELSPVIEKLRNNYYGLLEAAKKEHCIDQQTHGLQFGISKENCPTCSAISKAEGK